MPSAGPLPSCPAGLPARVEEIWRALLDEMLAAQVPVAAIDSHAITQTARCLHAAEVAEEMYEDRREKEEGGPDYKARLAALSLAEKYGNQLLKWLDKIGATPASRTRLGIKPVPEKKESALERILKDRNKG